MVFSWRKCDKLSLCFTIWQSIYLHEFVIRKRFALQKITNHDNLFYFRIYALINLAELGIHKSQPSDRNHHVIHLPCCSQAKYEWKYWSCCKVFIGICFKQEFIFSILTHEPKDHQLVQFTKIGIIGSIIL